MYGGKMITAEEINLCIDYLKKHPDEAREFLKSIGIGIGTISENFRNNSDNKEETYSKDE